MRSLAFAAICAAALLGACSAVDDFRKFKFIDDGGANDLPAALPGFGQACTDTCAQPEPTHPLSCYHMFGSRPVPGGMCTRSCTPALGVVACSGLPNAICVTVEGADVCLPLCDPSIGRNCRTDYACCANHTVVTGPGACAPTTTDLCH